MAKKSGHGCMGLRHTYGKDEKTEGNKHESRGSAPETKKGKAPFLTQRENKSDSRNAGPTRKNPAEGHGEGGGDESMPDTSDGSGGDGFAGKGKAKHGAKPKGGAVSKKHGWEEHGAGKPPFKGAAAPIHKQGGGKFVKGKK